MKDANETKKFQTWMHYMQPNDPINTGPNGKYAGVFGPQTTKMWNKYGNQYELSGAFDKVAALQGPKRYPGWKLDQLKGQYTDDTPIDPTTVPGAVQEAVIPGAPVADWVAKARADNMQMLGLNKPKTTTTTTTTSPTGSKFSNYLNSDKFRDTTENLAPFVSNIANAFRKPPIPRTQIPDQYTALQKINMNDARNQVTTTYQAADRSAERNIDSNAAEAIKAFNRGERISKLSTINEQEAIANSAIDRQQAGMDAAVTASNIAKQNKYRDELVERQIANQREQSANLANAGDKMAMLTTEKRKGRTEIEKAKVMSTAFKNSGVYDRLLKKWEETGINPLKGAYGGMIPKRKITY
jgi:hypothetical protein